MGSSAAATWAEELAGWTIPDSILQQAPEPPWGFPTSLFGAEGVAIGALHRLAREALPDGGSVIDVGCGGGAASIPLARYATELIGVDDLAAMLEAFTKAASAAGAAHRTVLGQWPKIARDLPSAEVVVCRNVVYNVADIVPFIHAMTEHATRRVVVELTETHPSVALAPLWRKFWDLPRPGGPTADLFAAVLDEAGLDPVMEREIRPSTKARIDPAEYVAFVRRRLCLNSTRDDEIAAALEADPNADETVSVVVSWDPAVGHPPTVDPERPR